MLLIHKKCLIIAEWGAPGVELSMHCTPQRATRRPYRTSLLINLGGSLLWSVHSLHNGTKGVSVCTLHSGLLGGVYERPQRPFKNYSFATRGFPTLFYGKYFNLHIYIARRGACLFRNSVVKSQYLLGNIKANRKL